jgi:hypothetical protein
MASIAASSVACGICCWCWWLSAPGLWHLATFTPTGPIRPMGLTGYLCLGVPCSMLGMLLVGAAGALSRRPAAEWGMVAGAVAALLPLLNFVLLFVIVFGRGIELSP